MSKQRQIKNFISITQTTDEVANYYMNHFYDVNEAVEAFFNNPLTLPSDMKVKRETPNKEKHIIFKTFEKYAENNVLSGENFTKFKEELKIEEGKSSEIRNATRYVMEKIKKFLFPIL